MTIENEQNITYTNAWAENGEHHQISVSGLEAVAQALGPEGIKKLEEVFDIALGAVDAEQRGNATIGTPETEHAMVQDEAKFSGITIEQDLNNNSTVSF